MPDIFGGTLQLMRNLPTPQEQTVAANQMNAPLARIAANAFLQAQERAAQEKAILQTRAGFVELGNYLSTITDWSDPKAEAGAWAIAAKNPWIQSSPMFRPTMDNFAQARDAKLRATITQETIASREAIAEINALRAQSPIGKLQADREAAIARGATPEVIAQFDKAISDEKRYAPVTEERLIDLADRLWEEGDPRFRIIEDILTERGRKRTTPEQTSIESRKRNLAIQIQNKEAKADGLRAKIKGMRSRAETPDKDLDELRATDAEIKSLKSEQEKLAAPMAAPVAPVAAPTPEAGLDDIELRYARDAIAAGIPKDRVAARYKQRTGKDFPE